MKRNKSFNENEHEICVCLFLIIKKIITHIRLYYFIFQNIFEDMPTFDLDTKKIRVNS